VKSLRLPDFSPKTGRRQFIGCKGLGFRAVLNWSHSPIILSGSLRLAYAEEAALRQQERMCLDSPAVRRLVETELAGSQLRAVPILAFPAFTENSFLDSAQLELRSRQLLPACEVQRRNFDTVIGMPFDRKGAFEKAREQIGRLRPEILLFAPALEKITIQMVGNSTEIWRRRDENGIATILKDDTAIRSWRVFNSTGDVPAELASADSGGRASYEIILAVPTNGDFITGPLFSYFPTEVAFPYPVICHATLDLQDDRKHPRDGDLNDFIFDRLADFMVVTAERLANEPQASPWIGAALLAARSTPETDLKKFRFDTRLDEATRSRRILPTLSGTKSSAVVVKRVPGAQSSWLPVVAFGDVMPEPDDNAISQFVDRLELESLSHDEWIARLEKATFSSMSERAAVIAGIVEHNAIRGGSPPALLVDDRGERIPRGTKTFLPPQGVVFDCLPQWLPLRFLNQQLKEALSERLRAATARDLRSKLSSFGVEEYALGSLIEELLRAAKARVADDPLREADYRRELIGVLLQLHPRAVADHARFPTSPKLQILTQAGTWEDVNGLYLGGSYGRSGPIMQSLFGNYEPKQLIAAPSAMGLVGTPDKLAEFALWVGVLEWPLEEIVSQPLPGYFNFVVQSLPETVLIAGEIFKRNDLPRARLSNVKSVEGLDDILKHASPAGLLAWIASDPRWGKWAYPSREHARLEVLPYKHSTYKGCVDALPSYIRWRFQNHAWLPTADGKYEAPGRCLLDGKAAAGVFPEPAVFDDPLLEKYEVGEQRLREAWTKAGVASRFADIDPVQVYEALHQLSSDETNGAKARSFYRALIDEYDARREFSRTGKLWGRHEGVSRFFEVKRLRYAATDDIPQILSRRIPLLDLPSRREVGKIERILGVQPVDKARMTKSISHTPPSPYRDRVASEFDDARRAILVLRKSQSRQDPHLNFVSRVQLCLCDEIEAQITFEDHSDPLELKPYDWILDYDTATAYLLAEPDRVMTLKNQRLAAAVAAILGSVFGIQDTGQYAQLLACEDRDRVELLRTLLGERDPEDVRALETLLTEDMARAARARPEAPVILPLKPKELRTEVEVGKVEQESETGMIPVIEVVAPTNAGAGLFLKKEEHHPLQPRARTRLRIQAAGGGPTGIPKGYHVTDASLCEEIAERFEREDGRFPLRTGHVQGYAGPRCDILSFADEATRAAFASGQRTDYTASAMRMIEVKGRSGEGGSIVLRGNQRDAAKEHAAKYYLYRIFEKEPGEYGLLVLRNPLNDPTGNNEICEINLRQATNTERFTLTFEQAVVEATSDTNSPPNSS